MLVRSSMREIIVFGSTLRSCSSAAAVAVDMVAVLRFLINAAVLVSASFLFKEST